MPRYIDFDEDNSFAGNIVCVCDVCYKESVYRFGCIADVHTANAKSVAEGWRYGKAGVLPYKYAVCSESHEVHLLKALEE